MDFLTALSSERLTKYTVWSGGVTNDALRLYALNVELSEAFYTPLHMLEIALRNGVNGALSTKYGDHWFDDTSVISDAYLKKKISEVKGRFHSPPSNGQVVAELTFGFWTGLFSPKNNHLWADLRPIFNAQGVQRRKASKILNEIRKRLRNRIAHHEPIIQYDLLSEHTKVREMLGWLSVDALSWCDERCRVVSVHPDVPIIVGNLKNPSI